MHILLSNTILFTVLLWAGLVLFLELGEWIGTRRQSADPEHARLGSSAVEAAIFGLLGLLLAFTFSGAATRFDVRRDLIIQEANAIGTAYLRLDVLPAAAQPPLRQAFRDYVDSRLEVYRQASEPAAFKAALEKSTRLQNDIWQQAVTAAKGEGALPAAMMLLVPALNDMIDITTTRFGAARTHPPVVIFIMLVTLELAAALLAGYGMAGSRSRDWVFRLSFATIVTLATYVIVDIEFPRVGFVRVDAFDSFLHDVRASMR